VKAIGLMSGTSADGVDAALVDLKKTRGKIRAGLIAFHTLSYPKKTREFILRLSEPGGGDAAAVAELNVVVGEFFARAALGVCAAAGVDIADVDFIGSHGQTIAHLPAKKATLQVGEPSVIAARTDCAVVADFRPADMARGGQGAPLTPIADYHLLGHARKTRVVINIGGITNVTVLPEGARDAGEVTGFDTGFGNMVLDCLAGKISGGKMRYDRGGRMARKGTPNEAWLKDILSHPFFSKKPPKSAGREEFGVSYVERTEKRFRVKDEASRLDLIATFTSAIARGAAEAVGKFALPLRDIDEVLLCGGGARNPVLYERFAQYFAPAKVMKTDAAGVPADAREAMAFAVLGYLTLKKIPGNIPAVTGASAPAPLGKCVLP